MQKIALCIDPGILLIYLSSAVVVLLDP